MRASERSFDAAVADLLMGTRCTVPNCAAPGPYHTARDRRRHLCVGHFGVGAIDVDGPATS